MRVVSWNMRRALADSPGWQVLSDLDPDIILLQEVTRIPGEFVEVFSVITDHPTAKDGNPQKFQSAVLSKFPLEANLPLNSELAWVNGEYKHYSGNILSCKAKTEGGKQLNLISFYSPAWHIPDQRLGGSDLSKVKLTDNPNVYVTEVLWKLLTDSMSSVGGSWIIGGDFNSSTTFDWMWGKKPRGNQEIIDRMNALGLSDCLSTHAGELVPTFKNARGGKVIHQMDYIYTDSQLGERLCSSGVVGDRTIFERSLSDHLPVVADFAD